MRSSSVLGRGVFLTTLAGLAAAQTTRIDLQRQSNTNLIQDCNTGQISASKGFNTPLLAMPFSATPTFDASAGNAFTITLTGDVTTSTLTQAKSGQVLAFRICQDDAGAHAFAWPANVLGAGSISPVAATCSQQSFIYDGAHAYAMGALLIIGIPGGAITLPGSTGGATSVQPLAVASGTLTLPAATDMLVARNTVDTLQNKTISGTTNILSPTAAQTISGFAGCGGGKFLKDDGTCGTAAGGSGGSRILGASGNVLHLPANTTGYGPPSGVIIAGSENLAALSLPQAGTISHFCARIGYTDTQPADGALTFTVRVAGMDTSIVATQPAGGTAPALVCDTTHAASVNADDLVSIKLTNASLTAVSAYITGYTFLYQ